MDTPLTSRSPTPQILSRLRVGAVDEVLERFHQEAEVWDPIDGRLRGHPEIRGFLDECHRWLASHRVSVEGGRMVLATGRVGREVRLRLPDVDLEPLEIASVAEVDEAGRLCQLRLYYDTRRVRARATRPLPALDPDPGLVLPVPLEILCHRAGGLRLEPCRSTDDGALVLLEFATRVWGRRPIPLQHGLLAIDRSPGGDLLGVRAYHGIDEPTDS